VVKSPPLRQRTPSCAACELIVFLFVSQTHVLNNLITPRNCGTPSKIAWPILKKGTRAAVTVTDKESHECVQYLQSKHVNAGPCGAATLAALRKLCAQTEGQDRSGVVAVLFSTEGMREYTAPV